MKKLVTALVIVAAIGESAFAQTQQTTISPQAMAAQAYAPQHMGYRTGDPNLVVVNGQIIGRDPDARIRTQLLRDPKPDAP